MYNVSNMHSINQAPNTPLFFVFLPRSPLSRNPGLTQKDKNMNEIQENPTEIEVKTGNIAFDHVQYCSVDARGQRLHPLYMRWLCPKCLAKLKRNAGYSILKVIHTSRTRRRQKGYIQQMCGNGKCEGRQ